MPQYHRGTWRQAVGSRDQAQPYESRCEAAEAAGDRTSDAIYSEAILVEHHSERRHRRDLSRMHRLTQQSWAGRTALDAAQRSEITQVRQENRNTPLGRSPHRAAGNQARLLTRWIEAHHTFVGGYVEATAAVTEHRLIGSTPSADACRRTTATASVSVS